VKPKILLASTSRWVSPARLALALAQAGCTVDAVCPPLNPLMLTHVLRQIFIYRGMTPLASFAKALAGSRPDLVIPCDDLSTMHLHELYNRAQPGEKDADFLRSLIERSLGAPTNFSILYDRTAVLEIARLEGLRVPPTEVVANWNQLQTWISRWGLPAVLKTNGTSGGDGVRIVRNLQEAESTFHELHAPPLFARAMKRALLDVDTTLIRPSITRKPYVVNVQSFVPGNEATSAVAAWKGQVLASLHFEVLRKQYAGGPATVLRLIDHPEMCHAAEKMVSRLGLSGLHGFDFMLENGTGNAHLIEHNPRATQVGHLKLGPGRDLLGALQAVIAGQELSSVPSVTEKDVIAIFPHECLLNPTSEFLHSGYHDVPWEAPDLVLACLRYGHKVNAWYSPQKWIQMYRDSRRPST
jgi:ATP-grasp domain